MLSKTQLNEEYHYNYTVYMMLAGSMPLLLEHGQ